MKKFVTSLGVEVEFRPISKEFMLRFNAANPQPPIPTYSIESPVTGTVEHIPLDQRSLREKPEQFTDAQHAAWREYAEKNSEYIMRFIRFFCLRGIVVNASMDEWLDEQRFLNIPVVEGLAEQKFEWITSAVLATEDDYKSVVLGTIEASGVPADLLTQVAESFRGNVQWDAAQSTGNGGEQVAGVAESSRSEGDVAPAVDDKPVGKSKRTRPRVGNGDTGNT